MRQAALEDIPAIRRVLGEAFESDPLFVWIFPDDEHRLNATAAWLGLFAEAYVVDGRADVVEVEGEIAAVALWRFPGVELSIELPTVLGLVAAFIGTARTNAVFGSLGGLEALHSEEPYAFLHLLAVSPRFQKRGLGHAAIRGGLDAASAAAINAELATMNPVNVGFYRSLGFAVVGEVTLQPEGPPTWVLAKSPST